MKVRVAVICGLLAAIVLLPILLRRESVTASARSAQDRLVVITPHNESIRHEFGEAFAAWWRERTGRGIYIDWRTPGGTSEIRMVLDAGFEAAEETGREGIGIDVFFGGGEPDFAGQSSKGRLERLRVFESMPGLFGGDAPIPETFTGERYVSQGRDWVGTCLSQFGICHNPDVIRRLGLPPPESWNDLADPRYAGLLALADPTKSGSVARTFELVVQGEIQRRLRERPGDLAAIDEGWEAGLRLIQRMAANARYFTDSASKIPHDVGQGNAAAGMCIDFYGRSYAEQLRTRDGAPRVRWTAPRGGTTLSADPVAVLKGAPRPEIAQAFVEFCLTSRAQRLWFALPGSPEGPRTRALHRTPIRRDVYTTENRMLSTMPGVLPYRDPGNFTYDRALTGKAFHTLRQLVKVMCIDSHEELKSSWKALRAAGMPPDALAVFSDMSAVTYRTSGKGDPRFEGSDPLRAAANAAELGEWFRSNYRRAAAIANAHATR